ncbi:MAG: hypothetical protein ACLRIS_08790 [Flavonifractor plautii]
MVYEFCRYYGGIAPGLTGWGGWYWPPGRRGGGWCWGRTRR